MCHGISLWLNLTDVTLVELSHKLIPGLSWTKLISQDFPGGMVHGNPGYK